MDPEAEPPTTPAPSSGHGFRGRLGRIKQGLSAKSAKRDSIKSAKGETADVKEQREVTRQKVDRYEEAMALPLAPLVVRELLIWHENYHDENGFFTEDPPMLPSNMTRREKRNKVYNAVEKLIEETCNNLDELKASITETGALRIVLLSHGDCPPVIPMELRQIPNIKAGTKDHKPPVYESFVNCQLGSGSVIGNPGGGTGTLGCIMTCTDLLGDEIRHIGLTANHAVSGSRNVNIFQRGTGTVIHGTVAHRLYPPAHDIAAVHLPAGSRDDVDCAIRNLNCKGFSETEGRYDEIDIIACPSKEDLVNLSLRGKVFKIGAATGLIIGT